MLLLQRFLLSKEGRALEKDNQKGGLIKKRTLFGRRALNPIMRSELACSVFNLLLSMIVSIKKLSIVIGSPCLSVALSERIHVAVQ